MKIMIGVHPASGTTTWPTIGECQELAACPAGHSGSFNTAAETGTA
jgi:hypothetical protein